MWKKFASLSLARPAPGEFCRCRAPVQQHPLGRVDPKPLENLGWRSGSSTISRSASMVAHSAEVVSGTSARRSASLRIYSGSSSICVWNHMDNSRRHGVDNRQRTSCSANRERQHPANFSGHSALTAGGGRRDDVAFGQRPRRAAPKRVGRAVEPQVLMGRGENDRVAGLDSGFPDLDEITGAAPALARCRPSRRDDVDPDVLAIRAERSRGVERLRRSR